MTQNVESLNNPLQEDEDDFPADFDLDEEIDNYLTQLEEIPIELLEENYGDSSDGAGGCDNAETSRDAREDALLTTAENTESMSSITDFIAKTVINVLQKKKQEEEEEEEARSRSSRCDMLEETDVCKPLVHKNCEVEKPPTTGHLHTASGMSSAESGECTPENVKIKTRKRKRKRKREKRNKETSSSDFRKYNMEIEKSRKKSESSVPEVDGMKTVVPSFQLNLGQKPALLNAQKLESELGTKSSQINVRRGSTSSTSSSLSGMETVILPVKDPRLPQAKEDLEHISSGSLRMSDSSQPKEDLEVISSGSLKVSSSSSESSLRSRETFSQVHRREPSPFPISKSTSGTSNRDRLLVTITNTDTENVPPTDTPKRARPQSVCIKVSSDSADKQDSGKFSSAARYKLLKELKTKKKDSPSFLKDRRNAYFPFISNEQKLAILSKYMDMEKHEYATLHKKVTSESDSKSLVVKKTKSVPPSENSRSESLTKAGTETFNSVFKDASDLNTEACNGADFPEKIESEANNDETEVCKSVQTSIPTKMDSGLESGSPKRTIVQYKSLSPISSASSETSTKRRRSRSRSPQKKWQQSVKSRSRSPYRYRRITSAALPSAGKQIQGKRPFSRSQSPRRRRSKSRSPTGSKSKLRRSRSKSTSPSRKLKSRSPRRRSGSKTRSPPRQHRTKSKTPPRGPYRSRSPFQKRYRRSKSPYSKSRRSRSPRRSSRKYQRQSSSVSLSPSPERKRPMLAPNRMASLITALNRTTHPFVPVTNMASAGETLPVLPPPPSVPSRRPLLLPKGGPYSIPPPQIRTIYQNNTPVPSVCYPVPSYQQPYQQNFYYQESYHNVGTSSVVSTSVHQMYGNYNQMSSFHQEQAYYQADPYQPSLENNPPQMLPAPLSDGIYHPNLETNIPPPHPDDIYNLGNSQPPLPPEECPPPPPPPPESPTEKDAPEPNTLPVLNNVNRGSKISIVSPLISRLESNLRYLLPQVNKNEPPTKVLKEIDKALQSPPTPLNSPLRAEMQERTEAQTDNEECDMECSDMSTSSTEKRKNSLTFKAVLGSRESLLGESNADCELISSADPSLGNETTTSKEAHTEERRKGKNREISYGSHPKYKPVVLNLLPRRNLEKSSVFQSDDSDTDSAPVKKPRPAAAFFTSCAKTLINRRKKDPFVFTSSRQTLINQGKKDSYVEEVEKFINYCKTRLETRKAIQEREDNELQSKLHLNLATKYPSALQSTWIEKSNAQRGETNVNLCSTTNYKKLFADMCKTEGHKIETIVSDANSRETTFPERKHKIGSTVVSENITSNIIPIKQMQIETKDSFEIENMKGTTVSQIESLSQVGVSNIQAVISPEIDIQNQTNSYRQSDIGKSTTFEIKRENLKPITSSETVREETTVIPAIGDDNQEKVISENEIKEGTTIPETGQENEKAVISEKAVKESICETPNENKEQVISKNEIEEATTISEIEKENQEQDISKIEIEESIIISETEKENQEQDISKNEANEATIIPETDQRNQSPVVSETEKIKITPISQIDIEETQVFPEVTEENHLPVISETVMKKTTLVAEIKETTPIPQDNQEPASGLDRAVLFVSENGIRDCVTTSEEHREDDQSSLVSATEIKKATTVSCENEVKVVATVPEVNQENLAAIVSGTEPSELKKGTSVLQADQENKKPEVSLDDVEKTTSFDSENKLYEDKNIPEDQRNEAVDPATEIFKTMAAVTVTENEKENRDNFSSEAEIMETTTVTEVEKENKKLSNSEAESMETTTVTEVEKEKKKLSDSEAERMETSTVIERKGEIQEITLHETKITETNKIIAADKENAELVIPEAEMEEENKNTNINEATTLLETKSKEVTLSSRELATRVAEVKCEEQSVLLQNGSRLLFKTETECPFQEEKSVDDAKNQLKEPVSPSGNKENLPVCTDAVSFETPTESDSNISTSELQPFNESSTKHAGLHAENVSEKQQPGQDASLPLSEVQTVDSNILNLITEVSKESSVSTDTSESAGSNLDPLSELFDSGKQCITSSSKKAKSRKHVKILKSEVEEVAEVPPVRRTRSNTKLNSRRTRSGLRLCTLFPEKYILDTKTRTRVDSPTLLDLKETNVPETSELPVPVSDRNEENPDLQRKHKDVLASSGCFKLLPSDSQLGKEMSCPQDNLSHLEDLIEADPKLKMYAVVKLHKNGIFTKQIKTDLPTDKEEEKELSSAGKVQSPQLKSFSFVNSYSSLRDKGGSNLSKSSPFGKDISLEPVKKTGSSPKKRGSKKVVSKLSSISPKNQMPTTFMSSLFFHILLSRRPPLALPTDAPNEETTDDECTSPAGNEDSQSKSIKQPGHRSPLLTTQRSVDKLRNHRQILWGWCSRVQDLYTSDLEGNMNSTGDISLDTSDSDTLINQTVTDTGHALEVVGNDRRSSLDTDFEGFSDPVEEVNTDNVTTETEGEVIKDTVNFESSVEDESDSSVPSTLMSVCCINQIERSDGDRKEHSKEIELISDTTVTSIMQSVNSDNETESSEKCGKDIPEVSDGDVIPVSACNLLTTQPIDGDVEVTGHEKVKEEPVTVSEGDRMSIANEEPSVISPTEQITRTDNLTQQICDNDIEALQQIVKLLSVGKRTVSTQVHFAEGVFQGSENAAEENIVESRHLELANALERMMARLSK